MASTSHVVSTLDREELRSRACHLLKAPVQVYPSSTAIHRRRRRIPPSVTVNSSPSVRLERSPRRLGRRSRKSPRDRPSRLRVSPERREIPAPRATLVLSADNCGKGSLYSVQGFYPGPGISHGSSVNSTSKYSRDALFFSFSSSKSRVSPQHKESKFTCFREVLELTEFFPVYSFIYCFFTFGNSVTTSDSDITTISILLIHSEKRSLA